MRNTPDGSTVGRVVAGLVMGSLTLALIGLTAVLGPIGVAAVIHSLVQLILPVAVAATVLITALSPSARTAWGRLCLINGGVSIALAGAGVQNGQPLWPTDPVYERALDQAMQWSLRYAIWTTAVYFAAATIIAAVLFAMSYWLLHSPHARHREAH